MTELMDWTEKQFSRTPGKEKAVKRIVDTLSKFNPMEQLEVLSAALEELRGVQATDSRG